MSTPWKRKCKTCRFTWEQREAFDETPKPCPSCNALQPMLRLCRKCGYQWVQRQPYDEKPRQCSRCKNPKWDEAPQRNDTDAKAKKMPKGDTTQLSAAS